MGNKKHKALHTSFISERTAEYILVPVLKAILKKHFRFVLPVFPWVSREGSILSRSLHQHDVFKVIGLFVKRPKFSSDLLEVQIKINEEFKNGASIGQQYGIPFILGCPIINNFWGADSCGNLWIKLDEKTESAYYIPTDFDITKPSDNSITQVMLDEISIYDTITKEARVYDINSFISIMRDIKKASSTHQYFGFRGYRPLYFLLNE